MEEFAAKIGHWNHSTVSKEMGKRKKKGATCQQSFVYRNCIFLKRLIYSTSMCSNQISVTIIIWTNSTANTFKLLKYAM